MSRVDLKGCPTGGRSVGGRENAFNRDLAEVLAIKKRAFVAAMSGSFVLTATKCDTRDLSDGVSGQLVTPLKSEF